MLKRFRITSYYILISLMFSPGNGHAQSTGHEEQVEEISDQFKIGLAETLDSLDKSGRIYIQPFEHGTLQVGIYRPMGVDKQQPHDKDEVYVIISGSGIFSCNDQKMSFKPGDVLFVPAEADHRFEEFSADFSAWVLFYGPEGGEQP